MYVPFGLKPSWMSPMCALVYLLVVILGILLTFFQINASESGLTTDNATRIMVSFGIPSVSPGLPLRTREEQRLWNRTIVKTGDAHLKNEKKGATVAFSASEDTKKILCINPISVELQAVHTNRPEKLFDGDKFKGCTVYSGKALCEFLEGI